MNKILTVVIPTYNMEKYLHKCLNSLLVKDSELLNKLEVIVVNDGSKDSSSEIAHLFEKQYPSVIKVIDKENGNYGSCINCGLKNATGKYIKILDADDSFNTGSFEVFLSELHHTNAELVLSDLVKVDKNYDIIWRSSFYMNSGNMPSRQDFDFSGYLNRSDVEFYGMMHGFTYRRDILIDNNYIQIEGIPYTDQQWVFEPIKYIRTAYYVDVDLYNYLVERDDQTVCSANMVKNVDILIFIVEKLMSLFNDGLREYHKYYLNQIKVLLDFLYKNGIIEKNYPIEKLISLDKKIIHNSDLNSLLLSLNYYRIPYIREWRNHNYLRTSYMVYVLKRIKLLLGKPV